MDIKNLATKPQLVKITLDDAEIVEKYGDALEFWVWDKQPLEKFVKFATASETDFGQILLLCSDLILDNEGKPVLTDGAVLPNTVLVKCVNKVVEQLGK
jgi:hypothetical protein